jgi:outer membrane receptor protein involved in Fe transport
LADGVPAGYNPPLGVLQGVAGATGGNPALQPEVAKTLTFGAIFTPRFVPGLAISVDRFAIDIDGFVSTVGRANKLNLCYTTTARQFCGDIVRGFRPEINANYAIVAVNDQLVNANNFELRGTDVEINYTRGVRFGLFNNERISAQVLGTYYDRAEQTETTGAITRLDGFAGGDTSTQGYIRWQANTNLRYASDFLNFNYNLRYIPKTETGVITSQYPLVPAESYHNVRLGINPFRNFEVYGGINNLTDNRPPILPDQATGSQAQNTISGFYDVFGRSYYVGTRIRF